jgi:uncharacterized protein YbaP (TraB family)
MDRRRRPLIGRIAGLLLALTALPALADPATWHVRGTNGELWILGSMHVLRDADYPLPASIDALFEKADGLVMELDLDDLDPAEQQRAVLSMALLPQGTVLADMIGEDVYRLASTRAAELGIELRLLERFEPWLVAITMLDQGMRRMGYHAERGIEQYLVARAQSAGKPIEGLETLEAQLAIFDSLPLSAQEDMLEQTLRELAEAEGAMSELTAAWRDGRLEELAEGLLDDFADYPGLYPALVTERNKAWIAPLERLLGGGGKHLVVVGALHLVGPENVIELLERRGHRVERVH